MRDMSTPCEDMGFNRFYDELINSPEYCTSVNRCPNYFFGFDSLDTLFGFLYEDGPERLEEWGFQLTEWEVTENYYPLEDGQVFFNKPKAKRIA